MQTIIRETEIAVNDIISMIEIAKEKVIIGSDIGSSLNSIIEAIEDRSWSQEEIILLTKKMRELLAALEASHMKTEMNLKDMALKQKAVKVYLKKNI